MTGSLSTARIGSGFIDYVEDGRSIPFWCRTGGGKVPTYVYCPRAIEWQEQHAWALDRKQQIIDLVIEHLRPKFPPFRVTFDSEAILALKKA